MRIAGRVDYKIHRLFQSKQPLINICLHKLKSWFALVCCEPFFCPVLVPDQSNNFTTKGFFPCQKNINQETSYHAGSSRQQNSRPVEIIPIYAAIICNLMNILTIQLVLQ